MARPPLPHAFLNGEFIATADAQVSAFDRGFLFGDGVYEVIPVYNGSLFHAEYHLGRLAGSLDGIGLRTPWDDDWWFDRMTDLIDRNGGGNQSLYLQVTRGAEFGRDHRFPAEVQPTVFMFCTATPARDPAVDTQGLKAVTAEDYRWGRCNLKVTSLLANVMLRQYAHEHGADEVVLHRGGRLTEASVSNIFIVRKGCLETPPLSDELLPGITRKVIFQLCALLNLKVVEMALSTTDLQSADELWVSSSTKEVAPIVLLDGKPIGTGKPGPIYAKVRAEFDDLIRGWG